jgi:hypothetical protein
VGVSYWSDGVHIATRRQRLRTGFDDPTTRAKGVRGSRHQHQPHKGWNATIHLQIVPLPNCRLERCCLIVADCMLCHVADCLIVWLSVWLIGWQKDGQMAWYDEIDWLIDLLVSDIHAWNWNLLGTGLQSERNFVVCVLMSRNSTILQSDPEIHH